MTQLLSLRLAQAQRDIPGGHYISKKELAHIQRDLNPLYTPRPDTFSTATKTRNPYAMQVGVFRYLDDVFNETYYERLNRMPINTKAVLARVEQYERFDSNRIMPHQWMAGLGFIKALDSLGFIENPKIGATLKRFKIEFATAEKRDHLTRAKQVEQLRNQMQAENLITLDTREIIKHINDASDPEMQDAAILMLFLGLVYSDAISITETNSAAVNALIESLSTFLKSQNFTLDTMKELNEDAELYLINFVNVAAYRTILEIKRRFESEHDPKFKLIYQMHEKQTLITALSILYENEDQFLNLQKLMYLYGLQTHELQESIFAAYSLHEAGQQDLCQDLILSKIDEVLEDFFGETMFGQLNDLPAEINFMENLVGHPFFVILNSIDPDFAFTVFEEHIAKLRLFEKSDSAYLPEDLRPADDNVFVPLMEVFPDARVLELCHNFLLSQHTAMSWKMEVLSFYDRIENKQLIAQSLVSLIETLSYDDCIDEDSLELYQSALDIVLRIRNKSDHLRLVESPAAGTPNFFFNLAKIAANQETVAQLARNTLKKSSSLSLKKQALSYLTQTAKSPLQRTEILHDALDVSFDAARTDLDYGKFALRLIEDIAQSPKHDSKVLFARLHTRLDANSNPTTQRSDSVIKDALRRALIT